jgi:hypothetical protein
MSIDGIMAMSERISQKFGRPVIVGVFADNGRIYAVADLEDGIELAFEEAPTVAAALEAVERAAVNT